MESECDKKAIDSFLEKCFPKLYSNHKDSFDKLDYSKGHLILNRGELSDGSIWVVFKGPVEVKTDDWHDYLYCGDIFGEFEKEDEPYQADVIAGDASKKPDIDFLLEWKTSQLKIGKSTNVSVIKINLTKIEQIREDVSFWRELCGLQSQKIKRIQQHYSILRAKEDGGMSNQLRSFLRHAIQLGNDAPGITDCGDHWKLHIGPETLSRFLAAESVDHLKKNIIKKDFKGTSCKNFIDIPKSVLNPMPEGSAITFNDSGELSDLLNICIISPKCIRSPDDVITFKAPSKKRDGLKIKACSAEDIIAYFPPGECGSDSNLIEYSGQKIDNNPDKRITRITILGAKKYLLDTIASDEEVTFLYSINSGKYYQIRGFLDGGRNVFSNWGITINIPSQSLAYINLCHIKYVIWASSLIEIVE